MKAMKPKTSLPTTLTLAALLASPALAIEPPADNAPPPQAPARENPAPAPAPEPDAPQAPDAAPAPQAAKEAAPYLGVGTAQIPDVLASHLGLEPGQGVVVRSLDPAGPAANAGITEHDVILRVNGTAVHSQAELAQQIQSNKVGAEAQLDLIHQGKPVTKKITLIARPDGGGIAAPGQLEDFLLQGMPGDQLDRIRGEIDRQLRALEGVGPDALPNMDGAMKEARKRMEEARKQMEGAMKDAMQQGFGNLKAMGSATFRFRDDQGSVELKSIDGGKEATVRDANDKEIWSGPWDTEQDKAAAPPEVRARIDKLNIDPNFKGQGLRLQLGPQFGPPDEPAPEADEDANDDAATEPEKDKPAE